MTKIKDLPRVDRPREKLLSRGPSQLTSSELLAIILRTGTPSMNAVQLATHILKSLGTKHLKDCTLTELMKINGLGVTKAAEIIAVLELGKRLLTEEEHVFLSPQSVIDSFKDLQELKKEHFVAVYLDTKNKEIAREVISIGTLNASLIHPRELFEPAIRYIANSIIVAHNHPSGDPTPSHEDLLITKQLKDAGELLDIHLLDHLIIAKNAYISFKEQGLI